MEEMISSSLLNGIENYSRNKFIFKKILIFDKISSKYLRLSAIY
jgi:hypothetical protein